MEAVRVGAAFPQVEPEACETAGGRVGARDGVGGLSSVKEECGAVSPGQSIPFHTWVKRKEGQEERDGLGGLGPLSQMF